MHRLYGPLGDVHALMSDSSEMACAFVVFTILAERGFVSKFEFKSYERKEKILFIYTAS